MSRALQVGKWFVGVPLLFGGLYAHGSTLPPHEEDYPRYKNRKVVCVRVCYVCMHACMHACMCIYVYKYVCMYALHVLFMHNECLYMYVRAYVRYVYFTYTCCKHAFVYVCMLSYTCMHVFMHKVNSWSNEYSSSFLYSSAEKQSGKLS